MKITCATTKTLANLLCSFLIFVSPCVANAQVGITWTARTAAEANGWNSVTYGNGLFVAVASNGTNRVMTSPDGITWTARMAAQANFWYSVTFGNGLFVATAIDGTNRVMTSPDGITWTARTAAQASFWYCVTYGNGLFVAVSGQGTVMTSPDGITWTSSTAAQANIWVSVTYANDLFVATSVNGTNRVMTSPDGVTWTARTAAEANGWVSVTYGNGLFVATANTGTNRVMTSPDGITWTARTATQANSWQSVIYGDGLFVAVSGDGTNRVMTSPDGITWTARTAAGANTWSSVTYENGVFVAVSSNGANQVMTSGSFGVLPVELLSFSGKYTEGGNILTWTTADEVNNKGFEVERLNGNDWATLSFIAANNKASTYQFMDIAPLSISNYRLRQIDNNGKETLSKVISIQTNGSKGKLAIYPNPVSNTLNIEANVIARNETKRDFQIINLLGQEILRGHVQQIAKSIDVSALPKGTYILKFGAEQVKFIKQ